MPSVDKSIFSSLKLLSYTEKNNIIIENFFYLIEMKLIMILNIYFYLFVHINIKNLTIHMFSHMCNTHVTEYYNQDFSYRKIELFIIQVARRKTFFFLCYD